LINRASKHRSKGKERDLPIQVHVEEDEEEEGEGDLLVEVLVAERHVLGEPAGAVDGVPA
jgi:hypothetical protein